MITKPLADHVIKRVLPNGLTVLIKPDHTAPIVAVNAWFGVGSVNETEAEGGLAHFQEHMVFKGTQKYGVGEIANLVKSAGGNLNAGTSYSYTMYYIVLPSRSFSTALEVQADAMMHSTFDPHEFTKERLVVIDEARMYDDRPESFTFYRTMELGYKEHTYRRPIAGYQDVVEKIERDQLLDFYNNYYRPSNAVLVVVGDVDATEALDRVEQVYGGWDGGNVTINEPPVEPAQTGMRFKSFSGTMDHGYLGAGFHVPNILHDDYPALEMLSELLSSGRSSRLYGRVLEDKRLVTSVSASLLAEKWPGFFLTMASMPPAKWQPACDAIFAEFERFKQGLVSPDELEKARRQVERAVCKELETMEGQASNMGYYQLLGDFRLADQHRQAIKEVTAKQIMDVARRYFHPDNMSLVSYLPQDVTAIDETTARDAISKVLSSDGGVTDMTSPDVSSIRITTTEGTRSGPAANGNEGTVKRITLDNGVRVLLKKRSTVPLVSVLTVFPGGSRFEPQGKSGVAMLTHRSIIKGTRSFDADEVVRKVESAGGSIDSFANFDSGGVYMNVLSDYLEEALPVYREVLREPRFDAKRVKQDKEKLLEELAKRHDNPIQQTMDELFAHVFGDHPYSHPFLGDATEAAALTEKDCADWYRTLLVPQNAVMTFVGDIDEAKARRVAEAVLGDLPAGPDPAPAFAAPDLPVAPGEYVIRRKDLRQSVTFVGFTAPRMMTDASAALQVLNGVLTGLGGRLFVELRDKRSLGYMTGSSFNPLFERSLFFGYANPGAEGIEEAVRVIMHELEKVAKEKVSAEELARSKEWLIGSQVMQLQRNSSQATAYGTYEALGFGWKAVDEAPARVQAVTLQDMLDVAEKVFVPEQAVVVKMLPESA